MEELKKAVPKSGSSTDKKSEDSRNSSATSVSVKSKLNRLRLKIRMMSNLREPRVLERQQTKGAYENTYKMEPDTAHRFSTTKADQVVREVFDHYLRGKSYDPRVLPRLIKTLSELIRDRVKVQGLERYKIIAIVTLIQNKNQGAQVSSRALWNQKFDNSTSLVYEGPNYYAIGSTETFPNTVYGLLESFLTRATRELRAEDGSHWTYELSSTLQPNTFENVTTYMDFKIRHTAQTAISSVFSRRDLRRFVAQNSNLVLLAECWPHKGCQNGSVKVTPQQVPKNFNLPTTLIVLSCLCLIIIVTGVVCSCLKRMQTSKTDTDIETKDFAENSQRILINPNGTHNPSVAASTLAGDKTSFYARAADEDEDVETLHSTWVIPLDEPPGKQAAVIVVTAEDTKL